jgi:cell division septum initiation protein DivIVA
VEIHETLDELVQAIESARAVPMSASCMVNRGEVLELLDKARRQLPSDLTKADSLLADAQGVIAEARRAGDDIIAEAHQEKMRLVSETEVHAQAEREAGRIVATAHTEAERMQREIDDYIDAKLANFELVLTKTLEAVARGRDKIAGRRAVEELSGIDLPSFDEGEGEDGGFIGAAEADEGARVGSEHGAEPMSRSREE